MCNRLQANFFLQHVDIVAKSLLGKEINFFGQKALITETESYSEDDPASHAYKGKITKRNFSMFESGGRSYVYLIYGMYYCLNFSTGQKGIGEAVLIRGALLKPQNILLDGPGKLCKYLGITKEHNNVDILLSKDFFIKDININPIYNVTTRIGINKAVNELKRFVIPLEFIDTVLKNLNSE